MEKRRLSLNRTGGAKNYNSPMKGGPYSAHPVHYKMIEDIHLDLDAMDNEIDKALNSTSTKVRQVAHSFTVLQSIYFDTDTGKWVLAQADDKGTIGTHIVVEFIDKDYFVAGLSGIFEVKNTLELGYWFTSDSVPGELIDTAPDINNPMIQVIDSNSIRVLDIGIVDNLDSIPASNVIVTSTVTPDFTPAVQSNNLQQVTNKVAGLQPKLVVDITLTADATEINTSVDVDGKALALVGQYRMVLDVEYVTALGAAAERNPYVQINGLGESVYRYSTVLKALWQVQGIANKNRNFADFMLNIKDGLFSANGFSIGWTGTSQTSSSMYNVKIESVISALNSIRIYQSGGDLMKAGSTLKIYQL